MLKNFVVIIFVNIKDNPLCFDCGDADICVNDAKKSIITSGANPIKLFTSVISGFS